MKHTVCCKRVWNKQCKRFAQVSLMQSIRKGGETNGTKKKWNKDPILLYETELKNMHPYCIESRSWSSWVRSVNQGSFIYLYICYLCKPSKCLWHFQMVWAGFASETREKQYCLYSVHLWIIPKVMVNSCLEKFLLSPLLGERQSLYYPAYLPLQDRKPTERKETWERNWQERYLHSTARSQDLFQWKAT